MERQERIDAIKLLEGVAGGKVIAYVTGDRHPAISAQVSDDAIRLIHSHLEKFGACKKILLFLYTRGGHLNAVPRLVHLVREYSSEFQVLVPYRAHSAGTAICLGADAIVMGKMGELSPVDPSTVNPFNPQAVQGDPRNPMTKIPISVEDVTAYLSLAEKAGLVSEDQRTEVFKSLASKVDPLALGNVHRVYNLIRLHTQELLGFQMKSAEDKNNVQTIVKALTETYTHDQLIPRYLAERIGLKVIRPNVALETAMWDLYELYERDLKLREIFDPEAILGTNDRIQVNLDVAFIETETRGDVNSVEATVTRRIMSMGMQPQMMLPGMQAQPPGTSEEFDVKIKPLGWRII